MSYQRDTMKAYMQDVGHIPLVPREEEGTLAEKIAQGNEEARAKLIKGNLRLVVKIAHDFKGLGLPLIDLISEGNIGLMRAAEKFDPEKGAKFSSYAAWWIKQSMRRALANQSRTIRIPVQSAGKINKIKKAYERLSEELGREPTDAEVARALQFSERTVTSLKKSDVKSYSLHDSLKDGEDGEFGDLIPDTETATPEEILLHAESLKHVEELLDTLNEREKIILEKRFGLNGQEALTLEELSEAIGRTRERVRQLQHQALGKLKAKLENELGRAISWNSEKDDNGNR